jgi:DNA/RNA-binding domain of Phe-tRNA-synthetase-like protein
MKDGDPRLAAARVCMVIARGAEMRATEGALKDAVEALAAARMGEDFPPAKLKDAVRDMLRAGGYKPAGRQKPASEYLAQAAREGRFPLINNAVDCNNLLSLETGLPISLLDLGCFTDSALVRIAADGESYVFNASGHEMDLAGLLCVCSSERKPLGNAVKDSMEGKLKDGSRDFAGFIYAPSACVSAAALRAHGERFAALLRDHCGAAEAYVAAIV